MESRSAREASSASTEQTKIQIDKEQHNIYLKMLEENRARFCNQEERSEEEGDENEDGPIGNQILALNSSPDLVLMRTGRKRVTWSIAVHEKGLLLDANDNENEYKIEIAWKMIKSGIIAHHPSPSSTVLLFIQLGFSVALFSKRTSSEICFQENLSGSPSKLENLLQALENQSGAHKFDRHRAEDKPAFSAIIGREWVELYRSENCIYNIFGQFPFLIDTRQVEIVYFERMHASPGLKNADMIFVLKNYSNLEDSNLAGMTVRLECVPLADCEALKIYLTKKGIKFYQGSAQLQWRRVLTFVRDGLDSFWEQGGWTFLAPRDEEDLDANGAASDSDNSDAEWAPGPGDQPDEDA